MKKFQFSDFKKLSLIFCLIIILLSFFYLKGDIVWGVDYSADQEFAQALNYMYSNGFTKYQEIDKYQPATAVTREQAAKFFSEFNKQKKGSINVTNKCQFIDLSKADATLHQFIQNACAQGIMKGTNNYFLPQNKLTKAEALTILIRIIAGIQDETSNPWYKNYFLQARKLGITKETNLANLNNEITRYELALLLFRTKNQIKTADKSVIIESVITGRNEITKITSNPNEVKEMKTNLKLGMITFNVPMQKASVEANLKIYPTADIKLTWQDDKNLEIEVNTDINNIVEYLVNIQNAQTATGFVIKTPIIKQFKTDGLAAINFVNPNGDIQDLTQNITVRFSKPIIPLTNLDNQPLCPILITPKLPGKCVRITTSTFQFRPQAGFPIGGRYNILVNSGIQTIAGDKTVNSRSWQISTPPLEILDTPAEINKDDSLNISFNGEINLTEFKENFAIQGEDMRNYNISYYIDENKEINQSIISIEPKSKDWGYSRNFIYTISGNLKSARGNIPLEDTKTVNLKIKDILLLYRPVVYKSITGENITRSENLRQASNPGIILPNNPMILFNFYEKVPLDKNLFQINYPFTIQYARDLDCSRGNCQFIDNQKSIILQVTAHNLTSLNINLLISKLSPTSSDISLDFAIKNYNKILDFKFIDYYKSCLILQNDIGYNSNDLEYFDLGTGGKITWISKISEYTNDKDCKYNKDKFTYIINSKINPDQDTNLLIKKQVLDTDNYPLDQDYQYKFHTNKALNEDKHVELLDTRDQILIPVDLQPLNIGIKTLNLTQVNVEVCEGDFDISQVYFFRKSNCHSEIVPIRNLGFKTNYSVINLNTIYQKNFTKSLIQVSINKLSADQTVEEAKQSKSSNSSRYYYGNANQTLFQRTNINAVLKLNGDQNLLRLTDFRTGNPITGQISKIETYSRESKYDLFSNYLGNYGKFYSSLQFTDLKQGIYSLQGNTNELLLITFANQEQILIAETNYYHSSNEMYTYLQTERPLYKPGDKVFIKGVSRILEPEKWQINTSSTINLLIRDSKYQELVNKTINLEKNGTFVYELQLSGDAPLGNYSINAGNNSIDFSVEEFEKPDFKLEAISNKSNYLYGELAVVNITGTYYIGSPLSNGNGKYTIKARDYNFVGGKTNGYTWGEHEDDWYCCYYPHYNYASDIIIENQKPFQLNTVGKKDLEILLENKSASEVKDQNYNVEITLQDPNTKKSVSQNLAFQVLRSPIFVGMKLDKYYYEFGDEMKMEFITVNFSGDIVAKQNLKLEIDKLDYEQNMTTYQREEKSISVLNQEIQTNQQAKYNSKFTLNQTGKYKIIIKLADKPYITSKIIYVSGRDLWKPKDKEHTLNIIPAADEFAVGQTAEFVIQSPYTGVNALLTIEKLDKILDYKIININSFNYKYQLPVLATYIPNVNINVFLLKPTSNSVVALNNLKKIRLEMQQLEQQLYSGNQSYYMPLYVLYDITHKFYLPISDPNKYDPTLLNKLAKLREEEQILLQNILPDYQIGNIDLKININPVKLNITAKSDQDEYLPSDKSIINLTVLDANGKPVNGEGVIAVIDEALLSLKSNNASNIVDFFYSNKASTITTKYNLINLIKRIEFNIEELEKQNQNVKMDKDGYRETNMLAGASDTVTESMAEESKSYAKKEIAAPAPAMMSKAKDEGADNPNATKIRENFKDLAFYQGKVQIINGHAQIEIPKLPDDLTTWVVQGIAYTDDTIVNSFDTKFKTSKKLALIPSIPRFFVAGDQTQIRAVLINNSNISQKVTGNLNISNANITSQPNSTTVDPNSQGLLVRNLNITGMNKMFAGENLDANINIKINSDKLVDEIKVSKKIIPYSTPEYTFTNGSTYDLSYAEKIILPNYLDQNLGKLELVIGATILTNLMDNINNLAFVPTNNIYSLTNALYKGAVLKGLYKSIQEEDKFNKIEVYDYNQEKHLLPEVMDKMLAELSKFQQSDGGFAYWSDCTTNYWREKCSEFDATSYFLIAAYYLERNGYQVEPVMLTQAKEYYKQELEKIIADYKATYQADYENIFPFYVLSLHQEKDYIQKYLLPNYKNISNLDKVSLVLTLQNINGDKTRIKNLITELMNNTLIEARGTFLPQQEHYYYYNSNALSTAGLLQVLINQGEQEKLLVENLARWLVAQKNADGSFGAYYDTVEVLNALVSYINYTGELKDISFQANAYLNNNVVLTGNFEMNNKFNLFTRSLALNKYLNWGEKADNTLGFEKKGTGKLYYDIGLRYFLPIEEIGPRDEGIVISRKYYKYDDYTKAYDTKCDYQYPVLRRGYDEGVDYNTRCTKKKLKDISVVTGGKQGEMLVGIIEVIIPQERNNVLVNNFIPAGSEIVNTNLDNSSQEIKSISGEGNGNRRRYQGFDHIETKTDRATLYATRLYPGTYTYTYVIKLNHAGKYHNRSAVVEEMKKPEIWGRTAGGYFTIIN